MFGFAIGNGESRIGFDLNQLKPYGKIVGCNALYREFTPDILIVVDQKMEIEVMKARYKGEYVYRRAKDGVMQGNKGDFTYGKPPYSAGPMATHILCIRWKNQIENIFLIGFDFFSGNGKVNNVFKGTKNYLAIDSKAPSAHNWIRHFIQVFKENKNKLFFRVMKNIPDFSVKEFENIQNLKTITYQQMFGMLNGGIQ